MNRSTKPFYGTFLHDGRKHDTQWAYHDEDGQKFLEELARSHHAGEAVEIYCGCRPRLKLRLIPYCRMGKCWLMRAVGDADRHAPDCGKSGALMAADRRSLTRSVFAQLEHSGELRIDEPLDLIGPGPECSREARAPSDDDTPGLGRATLLTFANVLFTRAGLDGTLRRRRLADDWSDAARYLREAGGALVVNDVPLSDRLAIPRDNDGQFEEVLARHVRGAGAVQRFAAVVAEVRKVNPRAGGMVELDVSGTVSTLDCVADTWNLAVKAICFPGFRQNVLARLDKSKEGVSLVIVGRSQMLDSGRIELVSARLMVVSRIYVPVESRPENRALMRLVLARRIFLKPLLKLPGMDYRPDFILYDTQRCCFVEVFGRDGCPHYDRNTKNKRVVYAFNDIDLVAWYAGEEKRWSAPPRRVSSSRRWRPDPLGAFGIGVTLRMPEAEAGGFDPTLETESEE